jgi:hypothetical protein
VCVVTRFVEGADGSLKALKAQREALAAVVGGAEHWLSAELVGNPSCTIAPPQ